MLRNKHVKLNFLLEKNPPHSANVLRKTHRVGGMMNSEEINLRVSPWGDPGPALDLEVFPSVVVV